MVGRVLRVLFGFLVACFVAGLVLVLFVNTPAEMPDWPSERYAETGLWALAVGTQVAIFASTFAFIGAVYAEWRGISSATYSIIVGLLIAMIAFASHYAGEGTGGDVSTYALSAFIVAGIAAGYAYWYVSGRYAGGPAVAASAEPPANGAKA